MRESDPILLLTTQDTRDDIGEDLDGTDVYVCTLFSGGEDADDFRWGSPWRYDRYRAVLVRVPQALGEDYRRRAVDWVNTKIAPLLQHGRVPIWL